MGRATVSAGLRRNSCIRMTNMESKNVGTTPATYFVVAVGPGGGLPEEQRMPKQDTP